MPYKIEWIESPWLLRLTWTGVSALPEYQAMINHEMRYMDAANGKLYWVCDLREVGGGTGSRLEPELMKEIIKAPTLAHPHCGQVAMVHNTALIRFLTAMIVQNPELAKLSGGASLRVFETMDEAETFCREVATADANRATACTLVEETNQP